MSFFSQSVERRREKRHSYSTLVHYRIKDKEDIWNYSHSLDISHSGIRLVINRKIENRDHIILRISLPGQEEPLELKGVAVWRKNPSGRSGIECGVAFEESACEDEMARLRNFLLSRYESLQDNFLPEEVLI